MPAVLASAKVVVAPLLVTMAALPALLVPRNWTVALSLAVRWAEPAVLAPAKVVVALSLVTMAAAPPLLLPRNWTAAELLAVMEVIPSRVRVRHREPAAAVRHHRADDRALVAAVAELQQPGADGRAAAVVVAPREDYRAGAGLGQRSRAMDGAVIAAIGALVEDQAWHCR